MARLLLGVSGGIAAYKSLEFARLATLAGHGVRVVMTPNAERFVGAASFEGIVGAPVLTSEFERDPMRANAMFVQLRMDDETRERALTRAGIPAERDAVQFGDPNRNGVFGVALGNRLIYAGHPERSYLIRRLTDPSAGPLMPLANCCFWSKESLRALWCWIAS